MVQMGYHEAVTNSPQWNAAFCYPEGLMRWWGQASLRNIEVLVTPEQVQLLSGASHNFLRKISDRQGTRAARPPVVRRDDRLLERRHARGLDRQRPGMD